MPARRVPATGAEFLVSVAQLAKAPGSRRRVTFEGNLDELAVSGSSIPESEPLRVDVVLESVSEGILLTGTVQTRFIGECRRCLGEATGELTIAIQELCMEDPTDELTYPLRPDLLDLAPVVHDACILALPLAPLCKEGCLGICSECGANRNLEQCSCEIQRDPRWDALNLLSGSETTGRDEQTPVGDE